MKKYISTIFLAFLFTACARELPVTENTVFSGDTMRFRAALEDEGTKAALSGSPSDMSRSLIWQPGDAIVVSNGQNVAKFTSIEESDTYVAEFAGSILEGTKYYASYPYRSDTRFSSGKFNINLPAEQKYVRDGIDGESLAMIARLEDGVFQFKNLCGIFVINVTGSSEVTSITFIGYDDSGKVIPVAGPASVDMNYTTTPRVEMASNASFSVSVNCLDAEGKGVMLSSDVPTAFHVALPPGEYTSFKVRVKTKDGGMVQNGNKPLYLKRSERKTATAFAYAPSNDYLSSGGTANCYIIPSFGTYCFDASVKGNSFESVGNAVSAEVLWETFNTTEKPNVGDVVSDVRLEAGDIYFKANRNGNALVAVKDADGSILWSWHLWVSEGYDAHASSQLYYNGAGIYMDRSLGALNNNPGDPLALGLVYQWGRKDPFPYRASLGDYQEVSTTADYFPGITTTSSVTIDYSVKHPMEKYYSSEESRGDWLYPVDGQLDTTRWAARKTKYDPCPPGWKVPDVDKWSLATMGYSGSRPVVDVNLYGVNLKNYFGDDDIWYQGADFYQYWWGSTAAIYYFEWRPGPSIQGQCFYFSPDGIWASSMQPSNTSFVRCCDERTSPEVSALGVTGTSSTSVIFEGQIDSNGGFAVTGTGAVCSTNEWAIRNMDLYQDYVHWATSSDTSESFSVSASGLQGNTTYYYRVFANNAIGNGYSEMSSFTTPLSGSADPIGNNPFEW